MTELAELDRFTAELPFSLDDFQQRACSALERGHGVLVCAPTGAGKTVVGEFAVHLALAAGSKCFYTTRSSSVRSWSSASSAVRSTSTLDSALSTNHSTCPGS